MDVATLMTSPVVTAGPQDTVGTALQLLEDLDIRHLPIVEGERLVGIVSDRDLLEVRLPLPDEEAQPQHADEVMRLPLSEVMRTTVTTLDANEPVTTAIDLFIEYRVGALPVLEPASGKLIGILSYVDVLRAVRGDFAAT